MISFHKTRQLQRLPYSSDDSETLATRWTAVESLKADVFSTKSDVWMIALFMYEVYTHGCWPYSELVDKETDNIMHMVSFLNVTSVCYRAVQIYV